MGYNKNRLIRAMTNGLNKLAKHNDIKGINEGLVLV